MSFVCSRLIQKTLNIRNRKFRFDGWYLKRVWKSDIGYMSGVRLQRNNNSDADEEDLLDKEPHLSPANISSPHHGADHPCACIHCHFLGYKRARTLSPASVRSPDPTISDLYHSKSFTLSPDISQREIFSDSSDVAIQSMEKSPTSGGVWAWDTNYIPHQRPKSPWLPSGSLSRLYLKRYTCRSCKHRRISTVRKRLKPNYIPCCKDALRKRLHPKYVILRSAGATTHDLEFEPKEQVPRTNADESFSGHCQLPGKQPLTFGDSLVDPRSKSVDVNFGIVISPPPAGRSVSAGQYPSKPRHILTPTSDKDVTSTNVDARLPGFVSPTKMSVDSRSKRMAKYPLNLILPVLAPPMGPTSDQMNRILQRHCHQRVIAFSDTDGLFYPGLVQKCVTPETSVIRFRHNGLFSEVPNLLTLPIIDMVHTQALNDGDTALVRVKNLNANCECWVPARIIGGFLGSPDPSFPLRHRYQLKLFSGSKHVFRRRDVLRISPLFYKGLLDYIRAKRGGDLPDQPAATGEEPAKLKVKLRKRQKPQSTAVSPRSVPRPRPKKVKKENETTPSASKTMSPLPPKLPPSAPPPPPPPLARPPSKASRKLGEPSFSRPPQKRPLEKQDKFITPPRPLQPPSKISNKSTELSGRTPKTAPQPPSTLPSAIPFKAKPAPPRKQPPPSTAIKGPAEKQPPQPPIPPSAPASTTKVKPKKPPVKQSKQKELLHQHVPTESVLQESPQVAEDLEGQSIVDTTTATMPVLSEDLHAQVTGSLTDGLAGQHITRSPSEDRPDHGESLSIGQQEPTMLAVGEEWPENEELELVNENLKAEQEETVQIQTIQEATSPEAGIHAEFTGLEEVSAYQPGKEELSPLIEEQADTISGVLTGLKAGPEVESAKPKTIPSENMLAESSNAPLDGTLETRQTVEDDGHVLGSEQSVLEEPLRVSTEASVIGGVPVLTAETDEGSKHGAAQELILQSDAVADKVSEDERLRKQVNDETIVDVERVKLEPEEQFISERSETAKSKATSGSHLQASEEDLGEMQQKPQQIHTGEALQYQVQDGQALEITQPTESVGHALGPSISKTTLKDESGAQLKLPPDVRELPGRTAETGKVSEQPLRDQIPDAASEKAMISQSPEVSSFKIGLDGKADKRLALRGKEQRVSGISAEALPTQKSENVTHLIPTRREHDELSEVTRTLEAPFVASASPTKSDIPLSIQVRKHDEQPSITRKESPGNVLEPQSLSEDVKLRKSAEDKIMDGSVLPAKLSKKLTDQHDEQVCTEATEVPEELRAPSTISIETDHSTKASAQERKVDLSRPVTSGIPVGEPAAVEQVAEDGRWMEQLVDEGIGETAPLEASKTMLTEDQRETVVSRDESPQDQSTVASIQERETDLVKPVFSEIPVGEPAAVEQVAEDGRWMEQLVDEGIGETAPLEASKTMLTEDQRETVVIRGESPQDQSTVASIQERETDLVKPVFSEIPVGEPAAVEQVAEDGRWMKHLMDENISETRSLEALKTEQIDQRYSVVGESESQPALVKPEFIPLPTTVTSSVKALEVSQEPSHEQRFSDVVIQEAKIMSIESGIVGGKPLDYEISTVRSELVGPPLYRSQEFRKGEPRHILLDEKLLLDSSSPLPSATAAVRIAVEKTETYTPLKDNLDGFSSGEGLHLSAKEQLQGARGIMKVQPHLKLAGHGSDHQLAERKEYASSRIQATKEPIGFTRTEVETEMTVDTACENDQIITNVRVCVSSPDLLTRDGGASPLSSPSFGPTSDAEGCEDGEPFGTVTFSVDIQVDVKLGNDGKHYIELQQHGPDKPKPFDEDHPEQGAEGNVFDAASVRDSSSAGKAQNLQGQTGIVLKTPLKKTSVSRPQSASCIRSSFQTEFSFNQPEGSAIHSARILPLTGVPDSDSYPPPTKTRSPDPELDRTVFDKGTPISRYRVSPKTGEHFDRITPTQHIIGSELKRTPGPQARGRRGQSAKVSARAALLDSGQNYGFVSKLSVEVEPLVEDSLIQPDTLQSQPSKENVVNLIALPGSTSEIAPTVSAKLDPIEKPEEPKMVGLKYFTSVDNEPLVTNETDVIKKKMVQVLTDASVVEEENTNPNTQAADSLVTPREVIVSNEYELEQEPTYSEHTSPGPFSSNKYELDTISPIHPGAISSAKAFEAKEYKPVGLFPAAENDEGLHVELVRHALAKASTQVQSSVDSALKDESDHRQPYITSGSGPQAFTDQVGNLPKMHGRKVPRTKAADSTMNSLLTSSTIEIVFKTGCEGQIEIDTASGINIRTSIDKNQQPLLRPDGCSSGRRQPVSPSSPETTENVRSHQSVIEQRILSPMCRRNPREIHMQVSTSLDAYAQELLCKPDQCSQEPVMLKSSEIKLSACRCALNKCTCFEHGQSTTPGQERKITKLSSATSQPDKSCILNLAVSVIHADEGELELTTQISTSKKDRSQDGHRCSRTTSPNVRGEAQTARNSPQTPTGLANLDDSTVAPKSITFNVSSTTKIEIPNQNRINCDLSHSNEQHIVISNPDNGELPVPPQPQSSISPQPSQKPNVTGVKFVQEITQELNVNEIFHSACPITLENETTIFENSNNSECQKNKTNQLYFPVNQPISPSKSRDEVDGVNQNLVNSTVLRLCNRDLGGKVLKTEFETDLGIAGHNKALDNLVFDVQTKLKSEPCTNCRSEEFPVGNDNCGCWSNNNTELLDLGLWQCFGQSACADDAASAFQMLNIRQNMYSGHITNVREYSIMSDEQKAVGYLQEHAFFCPSVRFTTALSAWEQSAGGVGCHFGRLVEEHSLPVGYGFTEADLTSSTSQRSVSQRSVCLVMQVESVSESESTLRQWNELCRDSRYSTRTSDTKGSHVQRGFYLTNASIIKTQSPLFIAVQQSVIPGVAIHVRDRLEISTTPFSTTNGHQWPEFRRPLGTSCHNSSMSRMTSTDSEYRITLLLNSTEKWLLMQDSEVQLSTADVFLLRKQRHPLSILRAQSQNDKKQGRFVRLTSSPTVQVSENSQNIEALAERTQEKSEASKNSDCHRPRMCSSTFLDDGNGRILCHKNLAWDYRQIASTGHLGDSLSECLSEMLQETQLICKLRYSQPDSGKDWGKHQTCKMEVFNFASILKPSTCPLLEVLCYSVLEETNCGSVENLITFLGNIEPVLTDTQESIGSPASFTTSIPQERDFTKSSSSVDSVMSSTTLSICSRQLTHNTDEHSSYLSSYGYENSVSGSKTNNEIYAPFDDEISSHSTASCGEEKRSFVSRTDPDMRAHSLDRHKVPAFNYAAEVRKPQSTIYLCDMCLETNCPKSCDPTVTLSSLLTVPTTGRKIRPESQRNLMEFPPKGASSHLISNYSPELESTSKPKQFRIHENKEKMWSSLTVKQCNATTVPIIVTQCYSFNTVDRSSAWDSLQHSGYKSSEYDETEHKPTEPDEPIQLNPLAIDRYSKHIHDSLPVMTLLEITEHCAMSDRVTEVGSREVDKVCWLVSTESCVCMFASPNTSSSKAGNHLCMSTTPFRCLPSLWYVDLLSVESVRLSEPEGGLVKLQFVEQWTFQIAFELLATYFDTLFQRPHCASSNNCFKTCLKIRPKFRGPESIDIASNRNVEKQSNAADYRTNAVHSTSKTSAKLALKTSVLSIDRLALTRLDVLPTSAQTTRQNLPNDRKTTTTIYKHGDLMGYHYNRTQIHLTRGVEQCTFKASYPSTADYSRSQPTRLLKLIRTALEAPLRPACALNHYTVQTVQPLLKVYAFSELIGNSSPLCHTGTTQKQSWCTILKSGLNVDSQDSRCLPLKSVAIPQLPTVRRLSLPLAIIDSMELVFSVPLKVTTFKKFKAHRSIPRTSIALTFLIKAAYLTKKVSLENISCDRVRTMTDTSHRTMDLTTASGLSNGHQRACSIPESFSTITRSDISKTIQTSIPEAEGLEGFSENSYAGEVTINSNPLSNVLPSSDRNNKSTLPTKSKIKQRSPTSTTSVESKVKKSNPYSKSMENFVKGDRRRQWSIPPVKEMVKTICAGGKQVLKPGKTGKRTRKADHFTGSLLPVAGDVGADTMEKPVKSSPGSQHSSGKSKPFVDRADKHVSASRKKRSSSLSSTASRLFQTLNESDSRKTEPLRTSPHAKSRIPIPVQHPISMMNACLSRLSLFQAARNQTKTPVLVKGSDSTSEHRFQYDRKISSILYSSATSSYSHIPASALAGYPVKRKCFTSLDRTQKTETAKALNTSDTRNRNALKQVSLNRFPSVSSRIPKPLGDDSNTPGKKHSVLSRIRTGVSVDHHKVCDINHACTAIPLKKTAGRSMVTPKREKKFQTSRN
ncbi:hypothetical protein CRM22_001500 [Opisthorchis felineus]|uniref:DUF4537 domain-containing protein n=1 Tax=Opisthorchis felineus TaxID=147828 RepID=A0A4V3SGS3_OPIFE|nr:hypothetical protein CRM22_001500 [Opisthorchis felineus]